MLDLSFEGSAEARGACPPSSSGPFEGISDTSQIPQLDLTGSVDAEGVGQSINLEGGVTITSDNAYVTYKGQAYEVGTRAFRRLESGYGQSSAQGQEQNGQSFYAGLQTGDPAEGWGYECL